MIGMLETGEPSLHLGMLSASSFDWWDDAGTQHGFMQLARLTMGNHLQYAMKWGFSFHLERHFPRGWWGDRQIFQLCALHTCDWLWFLGVDTIITNMTIDARQFCDPDYHCVIARDINGINNDSWFLRNCPETIDFTHKVLSLRQQIPSSDQDAMKWVLDNCPEYKIKVCCQRLFNSYLYDSRPEYAPYDDAQKAACGGSWEPGDFIVHFAGIDVPSRMKLVPEFLAQVVE